MKQTLAKLQIKEVQPIMMRSKIHESLHAEILTPELKLFNPRSI